MNVVLDSNNENNSPHKLSLTNTQVSKFRKAFANGSSANIKLSKTQLHKIVQSVGIFRQIFRTITKDQIALIGNVLKSSAKTVLTPLGLTAAASRANANIHKKIFGSFMYDFNNF